MEKGINTEKDFEIAKKIAHVLSGEIVLKRTEAVWMNGCRSRKATGIFMNVF